MADKGDPAMAVLGKNRRRNLFSLINIFRSFV